VASHEQALQIFRELGNRDGEARALNSLGVATTPAEARQNLHRRALDVATEIGSRIEQARAHRGIGRSLRAAGHPGPAQDHLGWARALYVELGVPDAEQVMAADRDA
jgi:hypothetical protein